MLTVLSLSIKSVIFKLIIFADRWAAPQNKFVKLSRKYKNIIQWLKIYGFKVKFDSCLPL